MNHRILFRSLTYCLFPTTIVFFFTFLYFFDVSETIKFFTLSKGFRTFLFISELLLVVIMYFRLKALEKNESEKTYTSTRLHSLFINNNLYYTSNLSGTIIIIKQFDND